MKKIFLLLAVAVLALSSCSKKKLDPYDMAFSIEVEDAKTGFDWAWVDIIPSNNDFHYWFGVMTMTDFSKFKSDKEFIDSKMKDMREEYEERKYGDLRFEDLELYKGAYFYSEVFLKPETEYIVLAFTVDDSMNALDVLHKYKFKTKDYIASDIDFDVTLNGSVFTVTPSNNDSYFYDYLIEDELEEDYVGSPMVFHYMTISYYQEYGFMAAQTDKGVAKSDAAEFYDLEPGDVLYVTASGYRYGMTSDIKMWKAVYMGNGQVGKVEEFVDPLIQGLL